MFTVTSRPAELVEDVVPKEFKVAERPTLIEPLAPTFWLESCA